MVNTIFFNFLKIHNMTRSKKVNGHYEVALGRCAALKAIDPKLDLGFGLTLESYDGLIQAFHKEWNEYQTAQSELSSRRNALLANEKVLSETSSRILSGVATRFGRDSEVYDRAGGTRTSERKKPKKSNGTSGL